MTGAANVRPLDVESELEAYLEIRSLGWPALISPEVWRERRRLARPEAEFHDLVAVDAGGRIVGMASVFDDEALPGRMAAIVKVRPEERGRGVGRALEAECERILRGRAVAVYVRDDEPESRAWAERRGFTEEDHRFQSRLALEGFLPAAHRRPLPGVRFQVLDDLGLLYELYVRLLRDVPDRVEPPPRERFLAELRPSHFNLVALDERGPIGLGMLWEMSPENGLNAFTGTVPEARGRGVARELKIRVAEEAIRRGYRFLHTNNNTRNAPMLALNASLGYERLSGTVALSRPAK